MFPTIYTDKNFVTVLIGKVKLYYSYQTLIAFAVDGVLTISHNYWSNTTGKHLNAIDPDKSKRVDTAEFRNRWTEAAKRLGMS